RLWRWCKRNPAVAALTAAVVLLLVAGAAVSTCFAVYYAAVSGDPTRAIDRANHETETARLAPGEENPAPKREAPSKERAQPRLGRLFVEKGVGLLDTDPTGAFLNFEAAYRSDNDDPGRAELHRLRLTNFLRQQQPRLVHLWSLGQGIERIVFSPDGRRVLAL